MNKEQFAELLNGRQYREEITGAEEELANQNGLLVCFGASDDLMEFRGIFFNEIDSYEGGPAFIIKKKGGKIDVISQSDLEELNDLLDDNELDLEIQTAEIVAEWMPDDLGCSWLIKTDLPHATFDIMDGSELYCRGIVIEKSDIINALNQQK